MLGPTIYLYDGARLIEEADSSGNILARYAHSTEVDEPLSMLRGTVNSYYQNDGIGSITSLSNQTAALAGTYTFDSFGKLTASTGAITNPFRYTGREFDTETGIYYYRARYFDPGTGRFVSEDPIRFGGDGPDFYAYVNNDPTDFTDPLGLCCDVPAHPLDVSPEYNMAQSQANGYRWWFNTVGQWGGPWDYKNWGGQKHPEWDDFGNFNAGATACALHIPLWITLRGAGWAKQRRTPNDPDGSWWGTWPYGNDAHKQDEVMAGWNWCHDGCAQPNPQVGAAPLPGPSFSAPVDGGAPIPIEW
jgi:RHS repeat-associated protein